MPTCASSGMRWCSVWRGHRFSIPTSGRWRYNAPTAPHLRPLLFLAYDESESLCGVAALAARWQSGHVSFLCATPETIAIFSALPEDRSAFVAGSVGRVKETRHRRDYAYEPAGGFEYGRPSSKTRRRTATVSLRARPTSAPKFRWPNWNAGRGESKPVLPGKKMVRRSLNAMGRDAPVRLDHARSWEAVEPILPQFIAGSHRTVSRIGTRQQPGAPGAPRVSGRIGKVAFRARLAGADPHDVGRERLSPGTMDSSFRTPGSGTSRRLTAVLEKYSPGFCLLAKLIEEAADNPALRTVDLGLGAEEYKDRFANQTRETLYVTLRTSGVRHAREILRYHAAEIVKLLPGWRWSAGNQGALGQLKGEAATRWAPRSGRVARRWECVSGREDEVYFFRMARRRLLLIRQRDLEPFDLNQLASAASQYVDDKATLAYLLGCASRLRDRNVECFGFVDAKGALLHFAWITAFDGFFLAELNSRVDAPSAGCVIIFDCWTPASARGHGYYGQAVSLIARRMRDRGKSPWIFSATSNVASVQGLNKTGFRSDTRWFGSGFRVGRGSKARPQSSMKRPSRRFRPAFEIAADCHHASPSASARRFAGTGTLVTAALGPHR